MDIETARGSVAFEVLVGEQLRNACLLIPRDDIQKRVATMGIDLARRYDEASDGVHVLTILNGAKHFSSDLERAMQTARPGLAMTSDTLDLSSYGGARSSGVVRQNSKLNVPIEGRRVLVVEDILDSGATLHWLTQYLKGFNPKSVDIAVLLDRQIVGRNPNILGGAALHSGFEIPEAEFVIGYGLDCNGHFRNLRDIFALHEKVPAAVR